MDGKQHRGVMIRRGSVLFFLLIAATAAALAQGVGTWKNYTSMKDVNGLARNGTTFWAATSGGLFSWVEGGNTFQQFANAEGLVNPNLTAVAVDPDGAVWFGGATGYLYTYQPANGSLRIIPDIAAKKEANKRINGLTIAGDTVLVSTDFGLSVFRRARFEFGDMYNRFAGIPFGTRISVRSSLIANGRIWAAVTNGATLPQDIIQGVVWAPLDGRNLLAPEAWTLEQVGAKSLPSILAAVQSQVYAGTSDGLYVYTAAGWTPIPAFAGQSVVSLQSFHGRLFVVTALSQVFSVDSLGAVAQVGPTLPFTPTSLTTDGSGRPAVGALNGGVLTLDSLWSSHFPNGPNSNQFSNVIVAPDGIVWGASGPAYGAGMYRFDGRTWTSYTTGNSALPMNEVYRLSVSCNGSVWASMWGRGLAEIPAGSAVIDSAHLFNTNVGMVGISNDPSYVVASNVVCDSRGNAWVSVLIPANKNVLAVRRPDNTWQNFPAIYNGLKLVNLTDNPVDRTLAVDGQDNLWAVARDPAVRGVICFRNGGTIDSVARLLLTDANGLPSNEVKTLVVDRDNMIWVGTDRGIGIILDPGSGAVAAYKPMLGITVNTIAVDPLNQKWVGTPTGVVLLSPDGTQKLAEYTVENTNGGLSDNDVRSIAVDPKTGTVYFGTANGLASLKTSAAAASENSDKLTMYPNPFRLPASNPLTIDGLRQNSQVKVMTVDGSLVRELTTPGGRLGFWDGKDEAGNIVASGIYIVVGYAEDGSVVTGKVAVLRK